jgi:hypothetical protein
MLFDVAFDTTAAFAKFDLADSNVREALLDELKPLAETIAADARRRAVAHFHSTGKKPGLYLASIYGDARAKGDSQVVGFVRSNNGLAHLLELGFTIRDWIIDSKGPYPMLFQVDGEAVGARSVHRHATQVEPYPAIFPAFEAARPEIDDAFERARDAASAI